MIKEIVIFSAGIFVGGVAVNSYLNKRHKEEIEELKEHYAAKKHEFAADIRRAREFREEVERDGYEAALKNHGYISESSENEDRTIDNEAPYIIPPTEFGDFEDYEQITLTFYSDGVLADENNEPVDIEMVGSKNLEYFGVYEEDSVYVRSDVRKCDYEILLCEDKHEDILKTMAPLPVTDKNGNILVYEDEEETDSEE